MMKTLTSISLHATDKNRQNERSRPEKLLFHPHNQSQPARICLLCFRFKCKNDPRKNINKQNLGGKDDCKCSPFSNSS